MNMLVPISFKLPLKPVDISKTLFKKGIRLHFCSSQVISAKPSPKSENNYAGIRI